MPAEISREEVKNFVKNGAQLVEVLSFKQYEECHLAGAVSIPLQELDQKKCGPAAAGSTGRCLLF